MTRLLLVFGFLLAFSMMSERAPAAAATPLPSPLFVFGFLLPFSMWPEPPPPAAPPPDGWQSLPTRPETAPSSSVSPDGGLIIAGTGAPIPDGKWAKLIPLPAGAPCV